MSSTPQCAPVHLISLHQQMEWIGFVQGSWFLMIKVNLKLFTGVCLLLILPATMGPVKFKHHTDITHDSTAHEVTFIQQAVRMGLAADGCFKSKQSSLTHGLRSGETKVKEF